MMLNRKSKSRVNALFIALFAFLTCFSVQVLAESEELEMLSFSDGNTARYAIVNSQISAQQSQTYTFLVTEGETVAIKTVYGSVTWGLTGPGVSYDSGDTLLDTFRAPETGEYSLLVQPAASNQAVSVQIGVLVSEGSIYRDRDDYQAHYIGMGDSDELLVNPLAGFLYSNQTPAQAANQVSDSRWSIYLDAGDVLNLNLQLHDVDNVYSPEFILLDSNAEVVATSSNESSLSYEATESGSLTIAVTHDVETIPATLTVFSVSGTVSKSIPGANFDTPDNSEFDTAVVLDLSHSEALNTYLAAYAYGRIEGQMSGNGDRSNDYYAIELEVGDRLLVNTQTLGGNNTVEATLYDSSREAVHESLFNRNAFTAETAGTYYVVLNPTTTSFNYWVYYALSVQVNRDGWIINPSEHLMHPVAVDDNNPSLLQLNSVVGSIPTSFDVAQWGVFVESGDFLSLSIDDTLAGDELALSLYLDEQLLATGPDITRYQATQTGLYSVQVASNAAHYVSLFAVTGTLEKQISGITLDSTNNGSLDSATALNLQSSESQSNHSAGYVYGRIEAQHTGDRDRSNDVYSLQLNVGDKILVNTQTLEGNSWVNVTLYSPSQESIHEDIFNSNHFVVSEAGTWYITLSLASNHHNQSVYYAASVQVNSDGWIINPSEHLMHPVAVDDNNPSLLQLNSVVGSIPTSFDVAQWGVFVESGDFLSLSIDDTLAGDELALSLYLDEQLLATGPDITRYQATQTGLYSVQVASNAAHYVSLFAVTGTLEKQISGITLDSTNNGSLDSATALNLQSSESQSNHSAGYVYGRIEAQHTGDRDRSNDVYSLQLNVGDKIQVNTQTLEGNSWVNVTLYSPSQESIHEDIFNSNRFVVSEAGTWYITLSLASNHHNQSVYYAASVQVNSDGWILDGTTPQPMHPIAQKVQQPDAVVLNSVVGSIISGQSESSWEMYLEEGDSLSLEFDDNQGSAELSPTLLLGDTELVTDQSVSNYAISETGLYTLRVSGEGWYDALFSVSGEIQKSGTLTFVESEPNDSSEQARALTVAGDYIGNIAVYGRTESGTSGDGNRSADHFVLGLSQGQVISERVIYPNNLSVSWQAAVSIDYRVSGRNVTLPFTATTEVELEIVASSCGNHNCGAIYMLGLALDLDSDLDGVLNHQDEFPTDPAASVDTDGDGYPDAWNEGYSQEDSTTGLTLDQFPDDSTEWLDSDQDGVGNNADTDDDNDGMPDEYELANYLDPHDSSDADADNDGDGFSNLNEYLVGTDPNDANSVPSVDSDGDGVFDEDDAFPGDPAASVDTDGDGYPDAWNEGYSQEDSTNGLTLDQFPDDSSEWLDSDQDGVGNNADPDDDNDGLPDEYEQANGLDPLDASDASEDLDNDGFSNLNEFIAGTDPMDPSSYLTTTLIDFETADFSQATFSHSGDEHWTVMGGQSATTGQFSAQAPDSLGDAGFAQLTIRLDVSSDGEIRFDRAVSSEPDYDVLAFYIDDELQESWSGELAFEKVSFAVSSGSHTFSWVYLKDDFSSEGQDTAWIDNIVLPEGEFVSRATTQFDYDGDGKADVAVRRPSNWYQYIARSSDDDIMRVQFGKNSGDIPVSGDFDGDGIADVAVRRPATATWYIRQSSDGQIMREQFGRQQDDIPVPADYDGDGITDIAVRRASTHYWYIKNSSGVDALTGFSDGITRLNFGRHVDDIPVPADYDGDGKADIAVRRPSNQTWYILNSSDGEIQRVRFGLQAGDIPVPADYDGDGKADIAVRRPSSQLWYVKNSSDDLIQRIRFGRQSSDIPIPADYDGDGKVDIAVRRPGTHYQYILNSSDGQIQRLRFGRDEKDIPLAAPMTIILNILNGADDLLSAGSQPTGENDVIADGQSFENVKNDHFEYSVESQHSPDF